jgi:hypothetical protein
LATYAVPKGTISGPVDIPPRVCDQKYLEDSLYQIGKEIQSSLAEQLEMTTWVATKALEALGSKSVELAQQHLNIEPSNTITGPYKRRKVCGRSLLKKAVISLIWKISSPNKENG